MEYFSEKHFRLRQKKLMFSIMLIIFCLLVICSCAGTRSEKKESWFPDKNQWSKALVNAAGHRATWMPLVGAVVIASGGWDKNISNWAVKTKPVYGSYENAENASDILVASSHIGMVLSSFAIPSKYESWLLSIVERNLWEHAGVFMATSLTDPIKRWTDRDRPNGAKRSFPSWHATRAAAYSGMGYRNIELAEFNHAIHYSSQALFASLAAGTAWARIEAGQHYPTDVLFGAALGNFVAIFVHDVFLSNSENKYISLQTFGNSGIILFVELVF